VDEFPQFRNRGAALFLLAQVICKWFLQIQA
jgi:hypothetical protein